MKGKMKKEMMNSLNYPKFFLDKEVLFVDALNYIFLF
jgi:hypothetical protein